MRLKSVVLLQAVWVSSVFAQAPATKPGGQGMPSMLIMMGLIMAIMYFLMIRPEKKRQKEREAMLASLKKNAKILTSGGIYGTVQNVKDKTVMVKVDDGVTLEFARAAITTILGDDGTVQGDTEKKA